MSLSKAYEIALSEYDGGDALDAYAGDDAIGPDYGNFDRALFLENLADFFRARYQDGDVFADCLELIANDY